MKQYLDLLKFVLENGEERSDRTGVGHNRRLRSPDALRLAHFIPAAYYKKTPYALDNLRTLMVPERRYEY